MGVFCVKPALLLPGVSDANVQPKFQLTVPLMRMISGSEQNLKIETDWLARRDPGEEWSAKAWTR